MIYNELLSSISSYSHRNDIAPYLAGFVEQAEAMFNRSLRTPYQEKTAYHPDIDTEKVAIPSDMLAVRAMVRRADKRVMTNMRPIDYRNYVDDDPLINRSINDETVLPAWTTEDMQFRLYPYPTPSDTFSVEILYYAKIPALSTANQTNWLMESHPDVYLAQCMLNARRFVNADRDQIAEWKDTVNSGLVSLKTQRLESMTAQTLKTELGVAGTFDIRTGWM